MFYSKVCIPDFPLIVKIIITSQPIAAEPFYRNAKRKKVNDLTEREHRREKKKWKQRQNECRKNKNIEANRVLTPPSTPEPSVSGNQKRGRKVTLRHRSKCVRENKKLMEQVKTLQEKIKNEQKKTEKYKKKNYKDRITEKRKI